jgi:hypothetical protein
VVGQTMQPTQASVWLREYPTPYGPRQPARNASAAAAARISVTCHPRPRSVTGKEAPSARAALLASSAALPRAPGGGLTRPSSGAPTLRESLRAPVAYPSCRWPELSVQLRCPSGEWCGRAERCASRDCLSGAAAFLADLRSAPPAAAISSPCLPLAVTPQDPGDALLPSSSLRCWHSSAEGRAGRGITMHAERIHRLHARRNVSPLLADRR